MTYQELVSKLKDTYQEKDASKISEHLAIQFNIQGEAEGALYLEIANGQLHVEPYEYYDRDILVTTSAADLLALAQGSLDILEAYQSGKISAEGNLAKAHQILKDDNMGPDTFAGACTYYDLYVAEENYDLAVNTQLDYLDTFGTQNIRLYSPIYVNLQEAKDFPLSDDTKQRYDAYMKECDESVARFAELDDLIKDKKYEEALEKCNTMKNVNGCTDYLLFYS